MLHQKIKMIGVMSIFAGFSDICEGSSASDKNTMSMRAEVTRANGSDWHKLREGFFCKVRFAWAGEQFSVSDKRYFDFDLIMLDDAAHIWGTNETFDNFVASIVWQT